jgi:hypothetical protein
MPVPDAPLVTVIHEALLTAVQAQLVPVVTETEPAVVPAAGAVALVAERV